MMSTHLHWLRRLPWQKKEELEALLATTLKPVSPSQDFVQALREKLGRVPIPGRPRSQVAEVPPWLLGAAALISASMVLTAGLRTAAAVLGAVGIAQKVSQDLSLRPRRLPLSRSH